MRSKFSNYYKVEVLILHLSNIVVVLEVGQDRNVTLLWKK